MTASEGRMYMNEMSGHWKKLVSDPKFLGEADLIGQPEIVATISIVTKDMVQNGSGKSEKTVVYFVENVKPMVLNVTNSKRIAKLAGSPLVEKWTGTRVQIYFDPSVKFAGDTVGGVRVRTFAPTIPRCEVCKAEIKAHGKRSITDMAIYTKGKYGKAMCAECATKAAQGGDEK
jgi:hypothetical protein